MSRLYAILLLTAIAFVHNSSYGQNVLWEGQRVDTIKIREFTHGIRIDKKGWVIVYWSDYNIALDTQNNRYIVTYCHQKEGHYNHLRHPDKKEITNKNFDKLVNKPVDEQLLQSLCKFLSDTAKSIDYSINNNLFSRLTSPNKIKEVVRDHTQWKYKGRSSRVKSRELSNAVRNKDTFKLFVRELETKDYTTFYSYTNAPQGFEIEIIHNKHKHLYDSKHSEIIGLPWRLDDSDWPHARRVSIDYRVNTTLVKILPNYFLLTDRLKREHFMWHYVRWYLKRRGILSV